MSWLRPAGCCGLAALFLVAAGAAQAQAPPPPQTFTVNSTDDATDLSPGDGLCATAAPARCTLRAAIQQANVSVNADTIIVPAGNYNLTIAGTDDTAVTGDLDITQPVTISGAGAASTVVNQTVIAPADRVF